MEGFLNRSGILMGLGLTLLGTLVQAALVKSPEIGRAHV